MFVCFLARQPPPPLGARAPSITRFQHHTQWRATVSRTPLDEWSARRRDLYLTTHNTHIKHPCPGGIRTHNLSRRAAADLRLRPRGHWDRQCLMWLGEIIKNGWRNSLLHFLTANHLYEILMPTFFLRDLVTNGDLKFCFTISDSEVFVYKVLHS